MEKRYSLNKYASIISRFSMQFYDQELSRFGIGGGQYFFLARIHEEQGVSAQELARKGHFDKATATRALQKLEELGYITRKTDAGDRRVQRFYTTHKADEVVQVVYEGVKKWNGILTRGLSAEETAMTEHILDQMAKNAFAYISNSTEEKSDDRSDSDRADA